MVWRKMLLAALVLSGLIGSASGGVLFNRKSKQKPAADGAGDGVRILRTDPDERRRAAAAEELSKIDLKKNPTAGVALLEAVQRDPSSVVRTQAAESLGKLRPLTVQVGRALEEAFNSDPAQSVRLAARNSLTQYVQAGFQMNGAAAREQANPTPNPLPASVARNTPPQQPVAKNTPIAKNTSRTPTRVNAPRGQTSEPPLAPATPEREEVVVEETTPPPAPIVKSQPKIVVDVSEPPLATSPKPPTSNGPIVETPGIGIKLTGPTIEVKPETAKPMKPSKSDEGPVLTPPG